MEVVTGAAEESCSLLPSFCTFIKKYFGELSYLN